MPEDPDKSSRLYSLQFAGSITDTEQDKRHTALMAIPDSREWASALIAHYKAHTSNLEALLADIKMNSATLIKAAETGDIPQSKYDYATFYNSRDKSLEELHTTMADACETARPMAAIHTVSESDKVTLDELSAKFRATSEAVRGETKHCG